MAKEKLPAVDANGDLVKTKFSAKSTDNGTFTVSFGNGTVLTLDIADVPEEIHNDLILHGISQMVGDTYAGAKGNYEIAIAAATKKIEQIKSGTLTIVRGTGESKPRVGELARALSIVKSISEAEALALLEKCNEEQKKTIRNHPSIKLEISRARTAKAEADAAKAPELNLG